MAHQTPLRFEYTACAQQIAIEAYYLHLLRVAFPIRDGYILKHGIHNPYFVHQVRSIVHSIESNDAIIRVEYSPNLEKAQIKWATISSCVLQACS